MPLITHGKAGNSPAADPNLGTSGRSLTTYSAVKVNLLCSENGLSQYKWGGWQPYFVKIGFKIPVSEHNICPVWRPDCNDMSQSKF